MKNIGSRILILSIVVVAGIFVLLELLPEEAEAAQIIGTVKLDDNEREAKVGMGDRGIVKFPGTVEVEIIGPGQSVQVAQVNLQVESNWPAVISPSTVFWSQSQMGQSKEFTVVVRVPNFTSFTTPGHITVSGTARTLPGAPVQYSLTETHGIISIVPFYLDQVSCDTPFVQINPGDPVLFNINIKNQGNSKDRVTLEILNLQDLTDNGWVVSIGANTIFIDEGKEEVLKVSVASPQDWTLYRNRIERVDVQVSSKTSQEHGSSPEVQKYPVYIREKGIYIPGFEPIFAILALAAVAVILKRRNN